MSTKAFLSNAGGSIFSLPRSIFVTNVFENPYDWASFKTVEMMLKRGSDIILATLGLLFLLPLLLLITLAVAITSPGPVIYKSLRIGKDKKPFYMYKFRTMIPDAHKLREQLAKDANLDGGELFKIKNDSRITPIGGFLRKYSLDEFPQLLNVIKGDMSLVGPRPFIPEESDIFQAPFTARFDVYPGITGPWQVGGRSDVSFDKLCRLEFDYVQNWSFFLDVSLLFKTIPAVVLKKGAY